MLPLLLGACSIPLIKQTTERKVAAAQSIRWDTHSTFDDRSGPVGSISLVVGSVVFPLRVDRPVAFKSLAIELQARWGVPKEAEIAALGWNAGYGEVLYALRRKDEVQVYFREVEEQIAPPQFKLIKRIPNVK